LTEREVSARIDEVLHARWRAEEDIAAEHAAPMKHWGQKPLYRFGLNEWVYDKQHRPLAVVTATSEPHRQLQLIDVVTLDGRQSWSASAHYWFPDHVYRAPCTCEVCVTVRDRKKLLTEQSIGRTL